MKDAHEGKRREKMEWTEQEIESGSGWQETERESNGNDETGGVLSD